MPILFVNGAQDFAYPLDSYAKTYHLVRGAKNISVQPKLGHGHMFEVREVHLFLDAELKGGTALPRVIETKIANGKVNIRVDGPTKIKRGTLEFTTGPHSLNKTRSWTSIPLEVNGSALTATAPPAEATAWYVTVEDERGALVSSELQISGN